MIAEDNAPQRTRSEAIEIAHKYFNTVLGEKLRKNDLNILNVHP